MKVLISIITFILGYLAEKILEFCLETANSILKRRKSKQVLHNFYSDNHHDIIITASGFPFYQPRQIREEMSNREPFLLAKPVSADSNCLSTFSDTDCIPSGFKEYIIKNSLRDQLEKARQDVFESFCQKSDGNYFNGTLVGVRSLNGFVRSSDSKEEPILCIDFYRTDYYTHKVILQFLKSIAFDSNYLKESSSAYGWARTSFGVSIILILPKQNEIILTHRSQHAAYNDGKEWIYVSVTETLSEADYNDETGYPDIKKCVLRGIHEELGISERELRADTLRFYDSFYETSFHQDNIVASIEISGDLTFSDIYSLLAKDKFLEVSSIITISNDKKTIEDYIMKNGDMMRAQTVFSLESYVARM